MRVCGLRLWTAAASLTGHTAEGIITVMHKYKLGSNPIAIIDSLEWLLHMRSTKIRRQAELFEDTLLDSSMPTYEINMVASEAISWLVTPKLV